MTATLDGVTKKKEPAEQSAEQQAAIELVRLARERGLSLTGPDGLLKQLTKTVIETALSEEMTEHLGYEKHDPAGAGTGNIRNGTRGKTVLSEASGQVEIEVPRDRAGTFEPQIVRKRQGRLNGVDQIVLSLYAKGLTTGEISAHFAEIYGPSVSRETISRITDKVIEEMNEWAVRPLDEIYAAVFIDAIVVKVRDGQVRARLGQLLVQPARHVDTGNSGHRVTPRLEILGRFSLTITRWPSYITTPRTTGGESNTTSLDATQVRWPGRGRVRPGGDELPTATDPLQASGSHQPLNGAAGHHDVLTAQLMPHLAHPIQAPADLRIRVHPLDLDQQLGGTQRPHRRQPGTVRSRWTGRSCSHAR